MARTNVQNNTNAIMGDLFDAILFIFFFSFRIIHLNLLMNCKQSKSSCDFHLISIEEHVSTYKACVSSLLLFGAPFSFDIQQKRMFNCTRLKDNRDDLVHC